MEAIAMNDALKYVVQARILLLTPWNPQMADEIIVLLEKAEESLVKPI